MPMGQQITRLRRRLAAERLADEQGPGWVVVEIRSYGYWGSDVRYEARPVSPTFY